MIELILLTLIEKQEELEESLKALVTQNNDLIELLKKANIKIPHFVAPKLLSFIVAVHDDKKNKAYENVKNKSITQESKTCQTPQEKTNGKSSNQQSNFIKTPNSNDGPDAGCLSKSQLKVVSELNEVQSFGSVDLIPVTNSPKNDLRTHEKPVKNFVEITPLPNESFEIIPKQPEKSFNLQLKEQPKTQGRK